MESKPNTNSIPGRCYVDVDADLGVVSVVADVDAGALVDADVNAADVVDGGSTLGEAANSC